MADDDESIAMLRASTGAIVPRGDLHRIRAQRFAAPGFDRTVWHKMAEYGWLGVLTPESEGGSGLGMRALVALTEELGAGLVPEPLIPTVMAARVLRGDRLAELLRGDNLIIPAWQERTNSLALAEETMIDDRARLSGRKLFVPMAGGADYFLISARRGLALVPAGAQGLSLALDRRQDGGFFGTLTLDGVQAIEVAGDFARALDEATLASAAYLVGVMRSTFAITLDYLKTRIQFGRPIGSFQVLRHRAVDLKIHFELARASVAQAATILDNKCSSVRRAAAVSRAKARAADGALLLTRQAIQLHGALGYTDEYDIGLFLRKAMVFASLYGSAAVHRARYAMLMLEASRSSERSESAA